MEKPKNWNRPFLKDNSFSCRSTGCILQVLSGAITTFGLASIARRLCGPNVDTTKLQLVGMLIASILLPGLTDESEIERIHVGAFPL
eukprot:829769-Amphidinium_carterae.1